MREQLLSTLNELLEHCYRNNQPWQEFYMPKEDALQYFDAMIKRGNIISIVDNGILLGYVEFWRINFEQFGRLIAKAPFFTLEEDTEHGKLCFIANIWIKPDFRRGMVFKTMEVLFFKMNNTCEYYCGTAWRKKTRPVKVFQRNALTSELFNFRS